MTPKSVRFICKALAIVLMSAFGSSCSSTKKAEDASRKSVITSNSLKRVLSQDDKESMYSRERSPEVNPKSFHNSKSINGKEYRGKKFIGAKDYRTKSLINGRKSSNWADKSARDSNKRLSSDLNTAYQTKTNRYSGRSARESRSGNYRTGTYKTQQDVAGTRGIENASPPPIHSQRILSEQQIQEMLNKKY